MAPSTSYTAAAAASGSHAQAYAQPERLIDVAEVERRTSLARTTIWRRIRDGDFPGSVCISPGRKAWREADVDAWIHSKLKPTP